MSPEMHGSSTFYQLLERMKELHDKKSHDYASDENPFGNYHFAGQIAGLFRKNHQDAGFAGRLAEKIYRLANLENGDKSPRNESIEDTELDIAVITVLWMADRYERRYARGLGDTKLEGELGAAQYNPPKQPIHGGFIKDNKGVLINLVNNIKNVSTEDLKEFQVYLDEYLKRVRKTT